MYFRLEHVLNSTSSFKPLSFAAISLFSHVLNINTLFGQRLNEPTSKSYLCCSTALGE